MISVTSLAVYSDAISFPVGSFANLIAIAYYSNGTVQDVSSETSWSSSDDSKVSITGSVAAGVSAGAVTLTASYDGESKSLSLIPFSATIISIEANKSSISLPIDGETHISVQAIYDNGQSLDITDEANYIINDTDIAGIDITTTIGKISPNSAGSTTLDISYNGESLTIPVEVSSETISSIQITPVVGSKAKGGYQNFYATASLSDGSTLDVSSSIAWSSSDESKVTISSSGQASLLSPGNVTISGVYESVSSSVNFEVLDKTVESIALSLSSNSLSEGVSGSVSVIATYSDSTTEEVTDEAVYSSSDISVASISNHSESIGKVTSFSQGTTTFSVSYNGNTDSQEFTVTGATLTSIEVTSKTSLLAAGVNSYFKAVGTYDDSSTVDLTDSVNWSLSNTSYGSMSNSSNKKGLFLNSFSGNSTDSLIITASLNGVDGTKEILLSPGTISSISITPMNATFNTNQNQDYRAYANFSDGASVEITDIVTWSSSDNTLGIISNSYSDIGRFSTLAQGDLTVMASYNGMDSNNGIISIDDTASPIVSDEGDGLLASYFSGNNFDTLKGQRIDAQLNFNWAAGLAPLGVGDNFSVRWSGEIKGKFTGDCQVSSRSDDGFRLYIDGEEIINVWFAHAPRWDHNYSVPFVEGEKQEILVEFFENGGHAVAELYWQCPGDTSLEPIPKEFLYSE